MKLVKQTIEMPDGTWTRITYFSSEPTESPVIVCLPALGVSARFYEPLAQHLVDTGYHVVTTDLRGNGHSSIRASRQIDFGYYEILTFDWPAILKEVRRKYPHNPIYLLGHSIGGKLATFYASLHPTEIQGLILVAVSTTYYRGFGFPQNIGMLLGIPLALLIAKVWGYFPGRFIGFAEREAKRMIRDWARPLFSNTFQTDNMPYNFQRLLGEIKLPILSLSLAGDPIAPQKSVELVNQKLSQASLRYHHVSPHPGTIEKFDHFNWVRHAKPLVSIIDKWINKLDLRS
jgi:predicted alpha/beta hydrolase